MLRRFSTQMIWPRSQFDGPKIVPHVWAGVCNFCSLSHKSAEICRVISRRIHCTVNMYDQNESNKRSWITEDLLELEENQPVSDTAATKYVQNDSRSVPPRSSPYEMTRFSARDYRKSLSPEDQSGGGMRPPKRKGMEGDDVVFGINPVLLALKERRRKFYRLLITEAKSLSQEPPLNEIIQLCYDLGIPAVRKQSAELHAYSANRPHQGVCLDCSYLQPDLPDYVSLKTELSTTDPKHPKLWLFLDSIMDPMNFGAILRSAYFFGVDRIFVFNSCPLTSTVSKASAGIMEIMSITVIDGSHQLHEFLSAIRDGGCSIIGTCSKNELVQAPVEAQKTMRNVKAEGNVMLVFGNEHSGVNNEVLPFCDQVISVEPGREDLLEDANCLNVSVAAGVILSHVALKRGGNSSLPG